MESFNEKEEHKVYKGNQSLENSRINRNGLPAGTPAPVFRLPQLDGSEVSLDDYRGRRVLLIFSDPGCGPCNQLAPQLDQLHRSLSYLKILVVSRGDPEANRAKVAEHGLTFPIVLQQRWEISREYSMFATPIAYLVDEHGVIAADVAVGIDAVLTLATEHEILVRSQKEGQIMRDRLQTRLGELKKEFATGQARLQELEKQQIYLRETVLRISGAIQVLEELLADGGPVEQNGAHLGEKQPLSGQVNPGNIIDPALQTSGLGDHDHGSRQNNPAMDTLGEKE